MQACTNFLAGQCFALSHAIQPWMKQQSWELPVDTSVLYLAFSASSMEKGQFCVVCVCMVGVCLCEVCVCVSGRVN